MSSDYEYKLVDRRRVSEPPARKPKTKNGSKNLLIRMPIGLANKVDRFSRATFRSMTAEVVLRLEASFEGQSIDEHGCIVVHAKPAIK